MDKIEALRKKLHEAMNLGNPSRTLQISQELDIEIVRAMREKLEVNQEILRKVKYPLDIKE